MGVGLVSVGAVVAGRYRVDAQIGTGGMSTVYAVTHRNGHRAALKMLDAQLSGDPETRARFLREAYVANTIAHPGVVRVDDDGVTDEGIAFLVLELLEGETIEARRLRLGGRMPLDEVLDTADQALDALAAAHDKGIVHRDVKPENFFLCHDGAVKLLDFGLARLRDVERETTRMGVTIGTPEFMPPEQALGMRDSIDARSDVWGLGATMFNAITGEYVHDAPNLHEQLVASATRHARPLRSIAPHVPAAVAKVIDKALAFEMTDRWQSAREMQSALRLAREEEGFESDTATQLMAPTSQRRPGDEFDEAYEETELAIDAQMWARPSTPPSVRTPPAPVVPPFMPPFMPPHMQLATPVVRGPSRRTLAVVFFAFFVPLVVLIVIALAWHYL